MQEILGIIPVIFGVCIGLLLPATFLPIVGVLFGSLLYILVVLTLCFLKEAT